MKEQVIIIPQYIRKVELSKSRMLKYYQQGKKAPKAEKYADRKRYDYKNFAGKLFLVDLKTGERVVANPRAAGTPRVLTINGQKIYNGEIHKQLRSKVMSEIKESFKPYIEKLEPVKSFPIKFEMEIHDVIREGGSGALWDMDNRAWPYIKAFQDCLTGNKDKDGKKRNKVIIPDDNILYVTQPPVPKFIPIDDENNRKLVFKIIQETDDRILTHKQYKEELKKL